MSPEIPGRRVMLASSILLALFVGLALFVVRIVQASPVPDSEASRSVTVTVR
jgi:hypothetical protein